ncbi:uncharacterized protein J3D65DRAFT_692652 [Phyllosticta citribraziliensis]|uniref:NACHT domain-containing protein n=1 Tax=Phyllosticta citribraziliensis TaxID=989973 RepID=A0ABR1LZT1_9PEZI
MSSEREVMRQHHSKVGRFFRDLVHHECKHVRHYREQSDSELEIASVNSHGQQGESFHAQHTVKGQTKLHRNLGSSANSEIDKERNSVIDEQHDAATDKEKEAIVKNEKHPKKANLQQNLWDQAYKRLKKSHSGPVAKFEKIVLDESRAEGECATTGFQIDLLTWTTPGQSTEAEPDGPPSAPADINAQLGCVINCKLKELGHLKWQDGLPEGVGKAIKVAQTVSDIVAKAVEKSSEASLAWSAITLCLPLMVNLGESAAAHRNGLAYIAARMEYFAALGRKFSECKTSEPEKLDGSLLELYILELYSDVLAFQLISVSRLYGNKFATAARDITGWDDWAAKLSSIQEKETKVRTEADDLEWDLSREHLSRINEKLDDYLTQLLNIGQQQLETLKQLQSTTTQNLRVVLTKEERECLSTFSQVEYERYKSAVPDRIPGTCEWFIDDPLLQDWLDRKSSVLLISAGPGCGKSVLTRYLIEWVLPTRAEGARICYFFFRDGQKETMNLASALCALIHQLLTAEKHLIGHAMEPFNSKGGNLATHFTTLWDIIEKATSDDRSEDVIIVLDALDECSTDDRNELLRLLSKHFWSSKTSSRLRFLCTTRPQPSIISRFDFPFSSQIKYDESDKIGEDVELVIQHRVQSLKLGDDLSNHLESRLLEVQNRTYLWVHLIFDFLDPQSDQNIGSFKRTKSGINECLEALPKTVEDAYDKLLLNPPEPRQLRRALCIILAAQRPFTVSEMNIAMEMEENKTCFEFEDDESFEKRLQSWSGLFISIIGKKVYLLHQTAREFLLRKKGQEPGSKWHHSISREEANLVLAETITTYITSSGSSDDLRSTEGTQHWPSGRLPLQGYIVQNFRRHFQPYVWQNISQSSEARATFQDLSNRIYDKVLPSLPAELLLKTGKKNFSELEEKDRIDLCLLALEYFFNYGDIRSKSPEEAYDDFQKTASFQRLRLKLQSYLRKRKARR